MPIDRLVAFAVGVPANNRYARSFGMLSEPFSRSQLEFIRATYILRIVRCEADFSHYALILSVLGWRPRSKPGSAKYKGHTIPVIFSKPANQNMNILIINSQGHWLNGWMTSAESQASVVQVLKKGGCTVDVVEVASPAGLETVLKNTPKNTLVWANAYWVNNGNGGETGLVERIEKYELPMVGSGLETLNLLLEKDSCQQKLANAGIPVPQNIVFQGSDIGNIQERIEQSGIAFPLVIKPTKESRSHGVKKVENMEAAVTAIRCVANDYPLGNIIAEEFLPTDDITCGYIKLNDEIIILPSFNVVKGMDCSQEVFGEKHYKLPPDYERQVIIEDKNILQQIETALPEIVDVLGIGEVTRIDGRLDARGTLKVFDVNGMPGLNYPISALIKQCYSHFPAYSGDYLFECLINTIVLENFQQYDMIVPPSMQRNHLFNLKSETIIRLKSKVGAQPHYIQQGV